MSGRMRRLTVALTAFTAAAAPFVVATPPAHAATGITSPVPNHVFDDTEATATVSGAQPTSNSRTVDRVIVTITPSGGGSPVSLPGCSGSSCGGRTGSFTVSYTPPANGTYTAVATAEHDGGGALDPADSGKSAPVTFGVEFSPAAPRRLVAEPNGAQRTVTLSWSPNSEPDLVAYQVTRSVDGGAFDALANVGPTTTTYTDSVGDGGNLAYQVVAVRRGVQANSIVASKASNTATTTIDRVTPPTTAASGGTAGSTDTTAGGAGSGGTAAGGGSGGAGDGSAAPTSGGLHPVASSAPVRIAPGARLDLSGYAPNAAPLAIGPAPTPDPGYKDTLPYQLDAKDQDSSADVPTVATNEAALPVGSVVTTTEPNRRVLLTFLAGAMLLFMLSMHLRWLLRRTAPVAG
jgi:hypothetical protein